MHICGAHVTFSPVYTLYWSDRVWGAGTAIPPGLCQFFGLGILKLP